MIDTIVLLTGPGEREALTALLKKHNADITVRVAATLPQLEAFDSRVLRRARLVAFLTPVIVPARILNQLGYGAYNFHPGPPDYPGWLPCHFAVYDGATRFGATAHRMIAQVDAGPIVDIDLFDVPPNIGVDGLERMAFTAAARLFWRLAETLVRRAEPVEELPIRWCGRRCTRRLCESLCDIPGDISKHELDRRVKAFGGGHFKIHPTIALHGHRFRLAAADTAGAEASPSIVPAQAPVAEPVG